MQHKNNCKQLTIQNDKRHSAICESLNANYTYSYDITKDYNYARAICRLIEKEYANEPIYFKFN